MMIAKDTYHLRHTSPIALVLFLILSLPVTSQTTYDFLSRPGLTFGVQRHDQYSIASNKNYRYIGDTSACGESLLIYEFAPPSKQKTLLRVEGGKVWRRSYTNPCDSEYLMFNFDLELGDKTHPTNGYTVVDVGMITLSNGEERRQLSLSFNHSSQTIEWVDGIGNLASGLFPGHNFEGYTSLICVKDFQGTILFNLEQSAELCDSITCFTPIPDFEVDQYEVKFKNLSVNQWFVEWDFGDGETSREFHPSRTYKISGCYDVTLSLSSECLSRSFEKNTDSPCLHTARMARKIIRYRR